LNIQCENNGNLKHLVQKLKNQSAARTADFTADFVFVFNHATPHYYYYLLNVSDLVNRPYIKIK